MPHPTYECPQCGKDDQTEQVSLLYKSGISVSLGGLWTKIPGRIVPNFAIAPVYNQTIISRKLSPPLHPTAPDRLVPFGIVALGVFVLIWSVIFLVTATAVWSPMLLAGASLVALGAVIFTKQNANQEVYNQLVKSWEESMRSWERLYYCTRDDCVFDPVTRRSVPLDEMVRLL